MEIDVEEDVEEECVYANTSEKCRERQRTTVKPRFGRKLFRMGALTLGLLCVLLATINISLRLNFKNNLTEERGELQTTFIKLQASFIKLQSIYNNVTEELQKEIGRLNERIRMLEEWRSFGNSWYYTSTVVKNWTDSRQDCLSRGADLVVINSREEQIFINGLVRSHGSPWIGLSDREVEGSWTWVDGTPLTTTYWWSSAPDSSPSNNEDCVFFAHRGSGELGVWDDTLCSSKFNLLCEK